MEMKTTLKSLNNQQTFLKLLIFSFVTVMIWIGFSIFSSQQKPQISEELQKMAIPLSPHIDMDVISRIEQKKSYTDAELENFTIFVVTTDRSGAQIISTKDGSPVNAQQTQQSQSTPAITSPASGLTTPAITEPASPAVATGSNAALQP